MDKLIKHMTDAELEQVSGGNDDETREILTWMWICGTHKKEPMDISDVNCWPHVPQAFVEKAIMAATGSKSAIARCYYNGIRNQYGAPDTRNTYSYIDSNGNTVSLSHKDVMKMVKQYYPAT
jgi:hypothetical protein